MLEFWCSFVMDSKIRNPKIYWLSTRKDLKDLKITESDDRGVKVGADQISDKQKSYLMCVNIMS